MFKIILTCVLFCITVEQTLSQNPTKHDAGNVYVDVLTRRFLDLESVIWKEIQQNAFREDTTYILNKIHTEFLKFYSKPFISAATPVDSVNIFNQKLFGSEIIDAENTVSVVKNHFLQREVDRSLDGKVITMARSHNTSLLDKIQHIAMEKDYFGFLLEV